MRSSEERATDIPNAAGQDAQTIAPISATTRVLALLRLMRPQQWVKNLLVYLALIFARRVTDLPAVGRVTVAFVVFCLAASAIYILNDLMDRERDRSHPRKRLRPLASGAVTPVQAITLMVACLVGASILTAWLAARIPLAGDPFARWGGSAALFVAVRARLHRRECALLALAQACRAARHLPHRGGLRACARWRAPS